ncbi:hypothetical protein [Ornithinibacillus halotolerans]|uniref:Phenylalanyl-tRNA synthetase subunit beta n=1 Tax=Ornithinibacillus halotolerans TaxID=1274357 RepID=A0A916S1Z6_9BACI|nr:hypothetical protein [Ornithinibacillus halotolerans]GGA79395.1 hypothetical protein GCM10008025_23500 [Ornithinibacillus halotolerans]
MKFIKVLFFIILLFIGLGFGIYYVGTNIASDKLMDVISAELEKSGELENIKQTIENDPELKAFIEDAKAVDEDSLPFTTKEEATRVVVKKLGISGLREIQSEVENGQMTKEELLNEIEQNFTEEEITALKVIAYKELYNK